MAQSFRGKPRYFAYLDQSWMRETVVLLGWNYIRSSPNILIPPEILVCVVAHDRIERRWHGFSWDDRNEILGGLHHLINIYFFARPFPHEGFKYGGDHSLALVLRDGEVEISLVSGFVDIIERSRYDPVVYLLPLGHLVPTIGIVEFVGEIKTRGEHPDLGCLVHELRRFLFCGPDDSSGSLHPGVQIGDSRVHSLYEPSPLAEIQIVPGDPGGLMGCLPISKCPVPQG